MEEGPCARGRRGSACQEREGVSAYVPRLNFGAEEYGASTPSPRSPTAHPSLRRGSLGRSTEVEGDQAWIPALAYRDADLGFRQGSPLPQPPQPKICPAIQFCRLGRQADARARSAGLATAGSAGPTRQAEGGKQEQGKGTEHATGRPSCRSRQLGRPTHRFPCPPVSRGTVDCFQACLSSRPACMTVTPAYLTTRAPCPPLPRLSQTRGASQPYPVLRQLYSAA